jgi:hypothetical protein
MLREYVCDVLIIQAFNSSKVIANIPRFCILNTELLHCSSLIIHIIPISATIASRRRTTAAATTTAGSAIVGKSKTTIHQQIGRKSFILITGEVGLSSLGTIEAHISQPIDGSHLLLGEADSHRSTGTTAAPSSASGHTAAHTAAAGHGHLHVLLELFGGHLSDRLRRGLQLLGRQAHHGGHRLSFLGAHGLEHLGHLGRILHTLEQSLHASSAPGARRGTATGGNSGRSSPTTGRSGGNGLVHHFQERGLIVIDLLKELRILLPNLS